MEVRWKCRKQGPGNDSGKFGELLLILRLNDLNTSAQFILRKAALCKLCNIAQTINDAYFYNSEKTLDIQKIESCGSTWYEFC